MRSALVDLARARHLPDWRRWQELTATAPPFLTPEFFTLASRFSGGAPALVAEAWDDDRMVGALPLLRAGRRLVALGCAYSPGYDYVGTPEGVDAIWRALRQDRGWDQLTFSKVPATSLLATRLPTLADRDGCPVVMHVDSRHPYFALPEFEAAMSHKFHANLRRCARKAGDLVLEKLVVPDRAAFDHALAIEAMAWKGVAGTSIVGDPRADHLYRTLLRLFGRRGRSTLYILRAGGQAIAMLLTIEDEHTLYALKIGYDPGAASVSPGHLLIWKVAADAEARGLRQLDFIGHEDEWKRKWTERVHDNVALTVYRDSAAGLARYAVHLARPHLPRALRGGWRDVLPRGCQRGDMIGVHTLTARVRGRIGDGLGIRSGIKRMLRPPPRRDPLGAPSQFAAGSWVRVKPAAALRQLLNQGERTRGLLFTPGQWKTAGQVFQIGKPVRRLRDDHGHFRPIARTVLLEGVNCAGHGHEPAGCGRHCPLMYRDEWLEPAAEPAASARPQPVAQHARVRTLEEINATLDLRGRRDGLTFMPEMAQHAGKRFPVASRIASVYEYDRWSPTQAPVYILGGVQCQGEAVGDKGPCDRACALMWHQDWLIIAAPRDAGNVAPTVA